MAPRRQHSVCPKNNGARDRRCCLRERKEKTGEPAPLKTPSPPRLHLAPGSQDLYILPPREGQAPALEHPGTYVVRIRGGPLSWRSAPFCSCTANCSQPPIPRASGLYRAPSAPGDRNCEAVPLGGPAVPLSPGVSLSMSTGWETGLSPSPSVRTPIKKKPLSDGVTDHFGNS